jgi:hypothetical protein
MPRDILHINFLPSVNCVGVQAHFDHCSRCMRYSVAQFLEALRYKPEVTGPILDGVTEFFH